MMAFVLLVLALLGMPLFAVLALAALGGYWQAGLDPLLAGMEFVRIGESPLLAALPLFAFAGVLLAHSRVPVRLHELMQSMPVRMPGTLLTFVLVQSSLALVLYAVVAEQLLPRTGVTIDALFLAGLLPGCLMLVLIGIYAAWLNRGRPRRETLRKPPGRALRKNALELPIPFVVLGGIYSDWLFIVEAAVIAAAWVLITVVLIRREVRLSKLPEIITEAMVLVAAILLLLGMAMASANVMLDAGVPQHLLEWLGPLVDSRLVFLLAMMPPLLVAGMLMGVSAGVVILAPVVIPVGMGFGVDPVHLGIVLVASLQIGCLTPPAGSNLLLASPGSGKDIPAVHRATLPLLGILLAALLIIAVWPALSVALPSLFAE